MRILGLGVLKECLPSLERAWPEHQFSVLTVHHSFPRSKHLDYFWWWFATRDGWKILHSFLIYWKGEMSEQNPLEKSWKVAALLKEVIYLFWNVQFILVNQFWLYLFKSSNTSGSRKLRRDQSSDKLFCRGVPVNSSLLSVLNCFNSRIRRQFIFLILCPSSTIKYFQ